MAYAAAITETITYDGGRRTITLEINETEGATTSEFSYGDGDGEYLPPMGTITSYKCDIVSGTATTIAPRVGLAAAWSDSTENEVAQAPAASAFYHDETLIRYTTANSGARPALYFRSTPDSGADNTITTIIVIVEGHLPS